MTILFTIFLSLFPVFLLVVALGITTDFLIKSNRFSSDATKKLDNLGSVLRKLSIVLLVVEIVTLISIVSLIIYTQLIPLIWV